MYYKLVDPSVEIKALLDLLSKDANGSSLRKNDGSFASKEIVQALREGSIVVYDNRPGNVKLFFGEPVALGEPGLKGYCVLTDCNTRYLMEQRSQESLSSLLLYTLRDSFTWEPIKVPELV